MPGTKRVSLHALPVSAIILASPFVPAFQHRQVPGLRILGRCRADGLVWIPVQSCHRSGRKLPLIASRPVFLSSPDLISLALVEISAGIPRYYPGCVVRSTRHCKDPRVRLPRLPWADTDHSLLLGCPWWSLEPVRILDQDA